MQLNPKTASKQWRRNFTRQSDIKGQSHQTYVKKFENGIVTNPIENSFPEAITNQRFELPKMMQKFQSVRNRFFVGKNIDKYYYA